MISPELLSAVLGEEFDDVRTNCIPNNLNGNHLQARTKGDWGGWSSHNIYELMYKCKEWAVKNGFWLSSWVVQDKTGRAEVENVETLKIIDRFSCKTEPEAVFEACQWILDNKGN